MRKHFNQQRISLLVPYRAVKGARTEDWKWLKRYWRHELPDAEIIIGHDHGGLPFSKTDAINDAAARAHGDIFVIIDADCYIPGDVITHCAERIRTARDNGVPLWFVPYRHIYRLTEAATRRVLDSSPKYPLRFPEPPDPIDVLDTAGSLWGHKFGALIMIMPREALEEVGCADPRFQGWGGEDVSLLRALDTLYARHKNNPSDVLHLYHPRTGGANWNQRVWEGQEKPRANEWLASKYNRATGKPVQMRKLVDEGCATAVVQPWYLRLASWLLHKVLDFQEWIIRLFLKVRG